MFRVKSENVYGMSEPGEESDPFDVASATTDRYECVYDRGANTKPLI